LRWDWRGGHLAEQYHHQRRK